MDTEQILGELLGLLEAGGVSVRYEPLGAEGGGLCTVKGERFFFVGTEASSTEKVIACAQAVSQVVDTENIYITPEVREFIQNHSNYGKE